jgi:hypothetical protein
MKLWVVRVNNLAGTVDGLDPINSLANRFYGRLCDEPWVVSLDTGAHLPGISQWSQSSNINNNATSDDS